jgi:hypothetical protein
MKKIVWVVLVLLSGGVLASEPLVVHEWGTFTVLQDAEGNSIPGVNINEESLPSFVHKLAENLAPDSHELGALIGTGNFAALRSKGIARYYHAALMRMETPIVYLYPPEGDVDKPIDLEVEFNGGWITEWYPEATVHAPGYTPKNHALMKDLTPGTVGKISWQGVKITPDASSPETDFPVWLAPRQTAAPRLTTGLGETEDYLFYRGVANLQAPLRVVTAGDNLEIRLNPEAEHKLAHPSALEMWLVEIKADVTLSYRRVQVRGDGDVVATTSAVFDADAKTGGRLALRAEMKKVLVAEGLFADEAEAMLNTWEVSYFRTPGLRLFFNLPQAWTDTVLPLTVKGYENTVQKRAMIGRIELVSARQQALLDTIVQGPVSTSEWFHSIWWKGFDQTVYMKRMKELQEGTASLEDYGMEIPPDYRAYMELGRFREALILHRVARDKDKNLYQFAQNYRLPLPKK